MGHLHTQVRHAVSAVHFHSQVRGVLPSSKHVQLLNDAAQVSAEGAKHDGEGPTACLKVEQELEERWKNAALAAREKGRRLGCRLLQLLPQR